MPTDTNNIPTRKPAVAGTFYSANPERLPKDLATLFSLAKPKKVENVIAIISPHAGFVYSGGVAASAFNQIDTSKTYNTIFVIGSSHQVSFGGAAIYSSGNFKTPMGIVNVDIPLAQKLTSENSIFVNYDAAHDHEHSLEVQLPFLQYVMKTDFKIVPIVIGTQSATDCKKIAEALKPYFTDNNLFIISTDFSHYPKYADAQMVDKITADAIIGNSSQKLLNTLHSNSEKKIKNLATSLCGWSSVLTLLYMTENKPNITATEIEYKNSGDIEIGDTDRVVGYHAIAFSLKSNEDKQSDFSLSESDKQELLKIARNSISNYLKKGTKVNLDTSNFSKSLLVKTGAFVTLKNNHKLRGCIGRFNPENPLYELVQEMAMAAATEDSRFSHVTLDELEKIEIEISVLTPLKRISSIDEIELGKHGIYIKKGFHIGTFLPQVATETGWTKEQFLGYCSRDKALLDWNGWKTAELYTYEAIVFE